MIYLIVGFVAVISTLTAAYAITSFTFTQKLSVPGGDLRVIDVNNNILASSDITGIWKWIDENERFELVLTLENLNSEHAISVDIPSSSVTLSSDWTFDSNYGSSGIPNIPSSDQISITLYAEPNIAVVPGETETNSWSFSFTEEVVS